MQILKWVGLVVLILGGVVVVMALVGASLPVKHTATRSANFNASPQQVWDVIAGPPTWRPEVSRYEELPARDGRREWIEYGKAGSKMTYEVVESDAPQKLVTRIADPHLPFGGTWTYEITPAADGTSTLTITENGEVYNPIFRFISRYVMGYTATMDRYLQALQNKLARPQS
jgi:uncharacterized protein YndB with AHSA1/START domain